MNIQYLDNKPTITATINKAKSKIALNRDNSMEIIIENLPTKEKARIMYYVRGGRLQIYYNNDNQKCYNSTDLDNLQKKVRAKELQRNYQYINSEDKTIEKAYLKDLTKSQLNSIMYYNDLLYENGVVFYIDQNGKLSVNYNKCAEIIENNKHKGMIHDKEVLRAYNAQKQREHRAKIKQMQMCNA